MGNVQPVVVCISVIVAVVVAVVAIEPHTHRAKLVIHMRFTATEAGEEGRHAGMAAWLLQSCQSSMESENE